MNICMNKEKWGKNVNPFFFFFLKSLLLLWCRFYLNSVFVLFSSSPSRRFFEIHLFDIGMAGILISVRFGVFFFNLLRIHLSNPWRVDSWFGLHLQSIHLMNIMSHLKRSKTNSFGSSFGSFGTSVWNDGIF